MKFRNPYLVQRCIEKYGKTYENGMKVSDYLSMDYMGSSEYEFGAIPKTLRVLDGLIDQNQLVIHEVPVEVLKVGMKVERENMSVFVLCRRDQVQDYENWIRWLSKNESVYDAGTKEYFSLSYLILGQQRGSYAEDTFWIVLDEDEEAALGLTREAVVNFKNALEQSVIYMNQQKKLREK